MAKIQLQIAGLLVVFLATAPTVSISAEAPGVVPKNGFVPDEKTAIAIAEAILIPIYGPGGLQAKGLSTPAWTPTVSGR